MPALPKPVAAALTAFADWHGSALFAPLLATLLFGAFFIADTWQAYTDVQTEARQTLSAHANAVRTATQAEVNRIDLALAGIASDIDERWRLRASDPLHGLADDLARRRSLLIRRPDLLFVDASGQLAASSLRLLAAAQPGKDYAEDEVFRIHALTFGHRPGLFLGKPHLDENGKRVIEFSRAVVGEHEQFLGAVIAVLPVSAVTNILRELAPEGSYMFALLDHEGDAFASYPSTIKATPAWSDSAGFSSYLAKGVPTAVQVALPQPGMAERLVSYQQLDGGLIIVAASQRMEDVLALWKRSVLFHGGVLACTLVIIFWSTAINLRRQRAIAQANQRFAALAEHSEDVLAIVDREGNFTWVSPAVERLTGVAASTLIGKRFSAGAHREDVPSLELAMHRLQSEPGNKVSLYCHVHSLKRGWIPIQGSATAHFDTPGIHGAIVILRDVSEREAHTLALQQSEEMFVNAQKIAAMGSWRFDSISRKLTLSAEAQRILGVEGERELTVRGILECVHPDDRATVATLWQATEGGEEFDLGHRIIRHGETRWIHSRASVFFDSRGKISSAVGALQDVTEQHLAASHLSELLAFNEKVIAESRVGIAVLQSSGPCIMANEALARMIGTERETIQRLNFRELPGFEENGTVAAAEAALRDNVMMRHLASGKSSLGEDVALDIELVPMTWQSAPHLLLMAKDYSDYQAAGKVLEEGRRMAEEASRAKSEFLANMSHEIRTPLNAVIGLAQLALDRTADIVVREYLLQTCQSANSLLEIINDILDYSKIEAGRVTLERTEFSVRDITARVIGLFRQSAGAKGLELVTTVTDDVPTRLVGDAVRISQIVVNLVANAVKFTESGSICMEIRRIKADDERASENDTSNSKDAANEAGLSTVSIEFSVTDTGIGMDRETLSQLFVPFTQADGSITRRYGGTGLGLTISRRLAELMGGRIEVTSAPGQGSRFALVLELQARAIPRPSDPGASESALSTQEATPGIHADLHSRARSIAGASVLVVEDDRLNQIVIEHLLTSAGLRVTLARHGLEALDTLKAIPDDASADQFDAILMDLQMPVMDGFAATRLIRANPRWTEVPIIAVTAAVLIHNEKSCLDAGMNGYVAKPVQPAALIDALAAHIRRGAAARAGDDPNADPDSNALGATRNARDGLPEATRNYLINLQDRLAVNDFIAVSELGEIRSLLGPLADARAERLQAAISRYDYAQAKVILTDLILSLRPESVQPIADTVTIADES